MTEQVKLESICPSCGKTDKLLWPDGCKNTWHMEGRGAMSEQMNVPDDLREEYETCCQYQNRNVILCKQLIERIAKLENHLTVATNAEKTVCTKALVALSAAGISTPEETYGYNTSWAISDLCRAVAALHRQVERLSAPVTDACRKAAVEICSTYEVTAPRGVSFANRPPVTIAIIIEQTLLAARKGAA